MFGLRTGKGFGECVRKHVVRGTVDKLNVSVGDCVPYEVVPNVNVLSTRVKLSKFGVSECECRLVVVIDGDGIVEGCEQFGDELTRL